MKKYKNKKIWELYSLKYAFFVASMVMTLIAVEQIKADMDEFLLGQLMNGWGNDEVSEAEEIVVFCQKK